MRIRSLLIAPMTVLALAACGSDDDSSDDASASPTAASSSSSSSAAAPTTTEETPPAEAGAPGGSGRPAPDTCIDLPEAPDGRYTIADAGTVTVTRDGDRLVLGEVSPAPGWTAEEIDVEDDEIEVEFRGDGIELDFEAEIDDGRLDVDVCHDDD